MVRGDLELSERLDAILAKWADYKRSTKAEVLRFAIDFLDAAMEAKKDGFTLGAWSEDQAGQVVRQRTFVGI